ncbi:MAG: site-specific integrase [Oleispira sp.]
MTHYLIKRGSIFYFNRRIRGNILRISLSTDNPKLAKEIAASIYLVTTKGIRHRMSYERIKQEAQRIASELHEEWLEDRLDTQFCESADRNMIANDEMVVSELTELIHERKLKGDRLKDALTDLAFVALKRKTLEEFSSPANILDSLLQPASNTYSQPTPSAAIEQILLTDKLEEFIDDKKVRSKGISDATLDEYRLSVSELVEICGNKIVSTYSFDDGKLYRNTMMQLPKHRKKGVHKNKSISELITLDFTDDQKLSTKTINGRITNLITYFTWLKQSQLVNQNPFENLKLQSDSKSYKRYSDDDLKLIFNSPLFGDPAYRKRKNTGKQSQWWLLVLATYTGARLGELTQLRLQDISKADGIVSISITDEGEGMRVKTNAGRRKLPVHPDLLKLGFEEYVTRLRNSNQEHLLPQLPKSGKKIGSSVSNWYNERYRDKFMPHFKAEKKVFHSFRHTFISRAINAGIETQHIQQMVGHEKVLLGETQTYADEGYSQKQLLAELNKLSYVNFSIVDIAGGWEDLLSPEPISQ